MEKKKIDGLWDAKDVAEYLRLSVSTIKLYVATEFIPSIKIGRARRFDPDVIKKWAKTQPQLAS